MAKVQKTLPYDKSQLGKIQTYPPHLDADGKYTMVAYGKVFRSMHWTPITDEFFEQVKRDFFSKPDHDDVINQLEKVMQGGFFEETGGTAIAKITKYYYHDLMAKCKVGDTLFTPEEAFSSKVVVEHLWAIAVNHNMHREKIESGNNPASVIFDACRMGGGKATRSVTQFKVGAMDQILTKYCPNGNMADPSCGWGIRCLGAIKNRVNYWGTDPNVPLVERINEMVSDIDTFCPSRMRFGKNKSTVKIWTTGSEIFHPSIEGKMGLTFTSPPYFDLEIYSDLPGQSFSKGMNYAAWVNSFVKPTIANCIRYVIPGGYVAFNIKDMHNGAPMETTFRYLMEGVGLKFVENLIFYNGTRPILNRDKNGVLQKKKNQNENMFVYQKPVDFDMDNIFKLVPRDYYDDPKHIAEE